MYGPAVPIIETRKGFFVVASIIVGPSSSTMPRSSLRLAKVPRTCHHLGALRGFGGIILAVLRHRSCKRFIDRAGQAIELLEILLAWYSNLLELFEVEPLQLIPRTLFLLAGADGLPHKVTVSSEHSADHRGRKESFNIPFPVFIK